MSEENERRERIINNMCMTLRHEYGMDKPEGSDFDSEISSGMTKYDRAVLHMEMSAIFDHHIAPILSELRDFQAGAKAEADAGDEARAEVRRLTQIIIHSEAGRIGANLKRVMDQKQIDELVALGIQQDKDEIARLMAENERWRRNYEHLIEQHMPRTGHGCEEGWSRVVEARELQAQVDQLKSQAGLQVLLPELDEALEDLEMHGRHSDQGYRKLKDWYRKVTIACRDIDQAMNKEQP